MSNVNLGSNYTHRVTLRLNDEQYEFLIKVSGILGVTPSDYIRMMVNTGVVATRNSNLGDIASGNLMKGMVGTNENVKTNLDNIV